MKLLFLSMKVTLFYFFTDNISNAFWRNAMDGGDASGGNAGGAHGLPRSPPISPASGVASGLSPSKAPVKNATSGEFPPSAPSNPSPKSPKAKLSSPQPSFLSPRVQDAGVGKGAGWQGGRGLPNASPGAPPWDPNQSGPGYYPKSSTGDQVLQSAPAAGGADGDVSWGRRQYAANRSPRKGARHDEDGVPVAAHGVGNAGGVGGVSAPSGRGAAGGRSAGGGLRQDSKYFEVSGMVSAPQQGHFQRGPAGELLTSRVHGNPPMRGADATATPPQQQRARARTPTPAGGGAATGGGDMSAALRRARTPLAKVLRDDDKKSFEMKREGQQAPAGAPQPQQPEVSHTGPHDIRGKGEQTTEELNPSREWVKAKFEEELERIKREQNFGGGDACGTAGSRGGGLESAPVGVDSPSWGVKGRGGLEAEGLLRKPSDGSCGSGGSGGAGRGEPEGLRRKNSGGVADASGGVRERRVAELERRLAVGLQCW